MSGTSMASPNLAGISALVKEYVTSADGLGYADGAEVNALVRALLMSTSVPLVHPDGLYYSPESGLRPGQRLQRRDHEGLPVCERL